MTDTVEKARRGRPPKDKGEAVMPDQMRRERRRKDGDMENAGLRLAIPDSVYEKYPKSNFRLSWIRDDAARIAQKHKEDWDPVEGIDPVPGALDRNGKPCDHILHVKRLDWVKEDRDKAEARRRQIEEQAARGPVAGKGKDAGGLADNVSYADASNRLR